MTEDQTVRYRELQETFLVAQGKRIEAEEEVRILQRLLASAQVRLAQRQAEENAAWKARGL